MNMKCSICFSHSNECIKKSIILPLDYNVELAIKAIQLVVFIFKYHIYDLIKVLRLVCYILQTQ